MTISGFIKFELMNAGCFESQVDKIIAEMRSEDIPLDHQVEGLKDVIVVQAKMLGLASAVKWYEKNLPKACNLPYLREVAGLDKDK